MTTAPWETQIPTEILRRYQVADLHEACFCPKAWCPGKGAVVVGLGIPECELQMVIGGDEPLAMINRPRINRDVKGWTLFACKIAAKKKAVLRLSCDTPEQIEIAIRRASKWLPANYARVPLERVLSGEVGKPLQ